MKKKHFAIYISVIFFLAIGGGGWYVYEQLNSPSNGSVMSLTAQKLNSIVSFNLNPVPVTSPYASFSYPKALTSLPSSSPPVAPELASFTYGYKDIENWMLAISVNSLSGTTLDSDSSYLFRKDNPSIYQESNVTYGGMHYEVMKDTQAAGFSEVAFAIQGNESVDISLFGQDQNGNQNLQATFATVLASWQWK
jgi:hypothetical protein